MSRLASLTLAAVGGAAVLGAVVVALRTPSPSPPTPAPAVSSRAPQPETPSGSPPRARPGRALPLEAAVKELELIRPSRQKAAADFTGPLVSGRTFRLADHRGKVVFINFWATWCAPCREEMPAMERLWRQHKDGRFMMVAVSVDADPTAIGPFVKEHALTFPVVTDAGMEVANIYGVRALPSSFVVDRRGDLVALALGPRAWDNDAAHSLIEGLAR